MKKPYSLFSIVFLFFIIPSINSQQESWPGYEGGNLHQNSSSININPANIGVQWKKSFDKITTLTDAWSYCKPRGNYGSRNLSINNGYIPVVAYDGFSKVGNNSIEHLGYLTVLESKTGRTANVLKIWMADGVRHCCADGADNLRGLQVTNYDAQTGILYLMSGGDGSGISAYDPIKNKDTYRYDMVQSGIPAYPARSTSKYAVYPTPGPNNTSFFEVDPAYPLFCYTGGTHSPTSPVQFSQKFLGDVLGSKKVNDFPVALTPFSKWGSVMTGNKRLFGLTEVDETNQKGIYIYAYNIKWTDVFNHGGDSLHEYDVAELDTAFYYKIESKGGASESYREYDGTFRNKAWLIDGKGVWAAWKPGLADAVELIHCDDAGIEKFSLNVCQGMKGQDVWPHISLAESGGNKYIVYYALVSDMNM